MFRRGIARPGAWHIGPNGAARPTREVLTLIMRPDRGPSWYAARGRLVEIRGGCTPSEVAKSLHAGAIMACARQIARKFDDIVEFAGVKISRHTSQRFRAQNARLACRPAPSLRGVVLDEVLSVWPDLREMLLADGTFVRSGLPWCSVAQLSRYGLCDAFSACARGSVTLAPPHEASPSMPMCRKRSRRSRRHERR